MQPHRITQKDIAVVAKVSRATVSMALTNHPSIPAKTRERVLRAAESLGYQPDPMLSALAAYRTAQRPPAFHGSLAWLFNSSNSFDWKRSLYFSDYFTGASMQARRHGYEMEPYDLNEPGQKVSRLLTIFAARNISGILLCPQPAPQMIMEFPWERFSVVTFGYSLAAPRLHTTAPAHYLAGQEVVRRMKEMGYRRIGFAIPRVSVERTNYNYLAGYLIDQDIGGATRIPPLFDHPRSLRRLKEWIVKYKIDGIIGEDARILQELEALGYKVPEDIGVASPGIPQATSSLSGVFENCIGVGSVAADFLVAMLNRGERGIPVYPQRVHVEGGWCAGITLRKQ